MTQPKTLLDGFGEASEQVIALRAEVARLRDELAEWQVENGMNRTFIREEMTRMSAVVEAARSVLEWPHHKYLVQLNLALESLDAAHSVDEESPVA